LKNTFAAAVYDLAAMTADADAVHFDELSQLLTDAATSHSKSIRP
jgi:hypothetical protein